MSAVARKYGVSVKELLRINGISDPTRVPDGKRLAIPSKYSESAAKPRAERANRAAKRNEASSSRSAFIRGDRVNIRTAPDTDAKMKIIYDQGEKVEIVSKRDGWLKVVSQDGVTGWVREDFVGGNKQVAESHPSKATARAAGKRVAKQPAAAPKAVAKKPAQKPAQQVAKKESAPKPVGVAKIEFNPPPKEETKPAPAAEETTEADAEATQENPQPKPERVQENTRRATGRSLNRAPEAKAPAGGNTLVRAALAYRGTPYRWGGEARGGFDCSGFTLYLYRQRGISLPHSASAQFRMGRAVSRGDLQAGDLVFFQTITNGISHVGMYIGEGKFVHASSRRSGGVRTDTLDSGYYRERYRGARRYGK
jgi:cell wall-associated NlpC family hydrolase